MLLWINTKSDVCIRGGAKAQKLLFLSWRSISGQGNQRCSAHLALQALSCVIPVLGLSFLGWEVKRAASLENFKPPFFPALAFWNSTNS